MSRRVFKLGDVGRDEANGVREALKNAGIEFYETPPANWGRSTAAIWVVNDADFGNARAAINKFQSNYVLRAKSQVPTVSRGGGLNGVMVLLGGVIIFLGYLWITN